MAASLLCCLIFTVPAYAQSSEPQPETAPALSLIHICPSYEIPGEALDDPAFAALMEEATKYIGWPYVWGGSSPSTSPSFSSRTNGEGSTSAT